MTTTDDPTPVSKKRTTKSPREAALANANAAVTQLDLLGERLFKINKPELTDELRTVLVGLRGLIEKL